MEKMPKPLIKSRSLSGKYNDHEFMYMNSLIIVIHLLNVISFDNNKLGSKYAYLIHI